MYVCSLIRLREDNLPSHAWVAVCLLDWMPGLTRWAYFFPLLFLICTAQEIMGPYLCWALGHHTSCTGPELALMTTDGINSNHRTVTDFLCDDSWPLLFHTSWLVTGRVVEKICPKMFILIKLSRVNTILHNSRYHPVTIHKSLFSIGQACKWLEELKRLQTRTSAGSCRNRIPYIKESAGTTRCCIKLSNACCSHPVTF
jgi:hypothetical protein